MLKLSAILAGCLMIAGAATYGLVTQTELFGDSQCSLSRGDSAGDGSCPLSAGARKLGGCCSHNASPETPVSADVAPTDGLSAVGGTALIAVQAAPTVTVFSGGCCADACLVTAKASGLEAVAGVALAAVQK